MPFFSIIIPVYNRPQEVSELLESLEKQSEKNFEIVIIEDGSKLDCKNIVESFSDKFDISYYYKDNSGPGDTRNYGAKRAKGDFLIFLDSDCVIPENYIKALNAEFKNKKIDNFGGPDKASSDFSPIQKAINYSMTSFFTTGGIRGGKVKLEKYCPRSFNMGISKEAFEKVDGFSKMRFGEDIDLSLRLRKAGYSAELIQSAFVYHKRRTDLKKFFKQVHNSGIARINLLKRHKGSMKIVHLLPSAFVVFSLLFLLSGIFISSYCFLPLAAYILALLIDSSAKEKSLLVGFLSVPASFVQLYGYGLGFIRAFIKRIIFGGEEFNSFNKNFYK